MTQPGTARSCFCAPGWCWLKRSQLFLRENGADGCTSRQDARDTAWMLYEETWQQAHDALVAAGAVK
jgi:hypothetical protein